MIIYKEWKAKLESVYSFLLKYSKITVCERIERKFEKQNPNLDVQFSNVHQEMNLAKSKHCTCSVVSYRHWQVVAHCLGTPGQTKVSGDRQRETTHEICCLAGK